MLRNLLQKRWLSHPQVIQISDNTWPPPRGWWKKWLVKKNWQHTTDRYSDSADAEKNHSRQVGILA
jgi:hypothetical protein